MSGVSVLNIRAHAKIVFDDAVVQNGKTVGEE